MSSPTPLLVVPGGNSELFPALGQQLLSSNNSTAPKQQQQPTPPPPPPPARRSPVSASSSLLSGLDVIFVTRYLCALLLLERETSTSKFPASLIDQRLADARVLSLTADRDVMKLLDGTNNSSCCNSNSSAASVFELAQRHQLVETVPCSSSGKMLVQLCAGDDGPAAPLLSQLRRVADTDSSSAAGPHHHYYDDDVLLPLLPSPDALVVGRILYRAVADGRLRHRVPVSAIRGDCAQFLNQLAAARSGRGDNLVSHQQVLSRLSDMSARGFVLLEEERGRSVVEVTASGLQKCLEAASQQQWSRDLSSLPSPLLAKKLRDVISNTVQQEKMTPSSNSETAAAASRNLPCPILALCLHLLGKLNHSQPLSALVLENSAARGAVDEAVALQLVAVSADGLVVSLLPGGVNVARIASVLHEAWAFSERCFADTSPAPPPQPAVEVVVEEAAEDKKQQQEQPSSAAAAAASSPSSTSIDLSSKTFLDLLKTRSKRSALVTDFCSTRPFPSLVLATACKIDELCRNSKSKSVRISAVTTEIASTLRAACADSEDLPKWRDVSEVAAHYELWMELSCGGGDSSAITDVRLLPNGRAVANVLIGESSSASASSTFVSKLQHSGGFYIAFVTALLREFNDGGGGRAEEGSVAARASALAQRLASGATSLEAAFAEFSDPVEVALAWQQINDDVTKRTEEERELFSFVVDELFDNRAAIATFVRQRGLLRDSMTHRIVSNIEAVCDDDDDDDVDQEDAAEDGDDDDEQELDGFPSLPLAIVCRMYQLFGEAEITRQQFNERVYLQVRPYCTTEQQQRLGTSLKSVISELGKQKVLSVSAASGKLTLTAQWARSADGFLSRIAAKTTAAAAVVEGGGKEVKHNSVKNMSVIRLLYELVAVLEALADEK